MHGAASGDGSFNVLLLGCGDLRHCLFSLVGRTLVDNVGPDKQRRPTLSYVVNDFDPCVIARDILLLDMVLDKSASVSDIFAVWFSFGLTEAQHDMLIDRLQQLLDSDSGDDAAAAAAKHWSFYGDVRQQRA